MSIRKIGRTQWRVYFDAFSKQLRDERRTDYAEVRVFSQEDGAQQETTWLPLRGITFDPKSDQLGVIVDHLDHRVDHPSEIYVDEADGGELLRFEVLRQDGTMEIIELR